MYVDSVPGELKLSTNINSESTTGSFLGRLTSSYSSIFSSLVYYLLAKPLNSETSD